MSGSQVDFEAAQAIIDNRAGHTEECLTRLNSPLAMALGVCRLPCSCGATQRLAAQVLNTLRKRDEEIVALRSQGAAMTDQDLAERIVATRREFERLDAERRRRETIEWARTRLFGS